MSALDKAYGASPRAVQHLAVSARGLQIRRSRLGPAFRRALADYERSNRSAEATARVQQEGLRSLLDRLADSAPAFADRGARIEHLDELPVCTKADLLRDPAGYRLAFDGAVADVSTGGSTGSPLRFPTSWEAISRQWAVWWRYRRWHGIGLDTWSAHFGGTTVCPLDERSVFWRYNVPGRQVQFSARHLTPDTVARYVAEIDRRRLPWIHGLPSTIGQLATSMAAAGLRFQQPPRWVTFGSENVPESLPALIEATWGVRPTQHYGLAEAVANFSECPDGRLHVDEDFSVVEFLPYDDPSATGGDPGLRRVVGTAITNPVQAFVRYDTTDLVSGIEAGCSCGRPGRTVAAIDGRTASYAALASGARIGPVSHLFRDLPGVVQGQVFVPEAGGLLVHLVVGEGYGPSVEAELRARVLARSPEPVAVEVQVRPALQRGPNGKVPVVVQGDPS